MALFVDLDEDGVEPPQQGGKPVWNGLLPHRPVDSTPCTRADQEHVVEDEVDEAEATVDSQAQGSAVTETFNLNRNSMTEALGCYPIVMAIASSIDLNTLDNLSRTCRQVRQGLLQYRTMLLVSTLHCCNEDLPVDKDEILRYRARAGNWFYMQDISRTNHTGKSGQCARDLVSECRRCGTVVCRNCAIKPPAPIVLRDRHRRLCSTCTRAPLGRLVRPQLPADTPADAEQMQVAICKCDPEGVWLCQPCGRTIRSDDYDYKGLWRWRNQYGEVLGGLGTGIGDADRGVICGREGACLGAREREQETDCDAEDAREADSYYHHYSASSASASPPSSLLGGGVGGGIGGPPSVAGGGGSSTNGSELGTSLNNHNGAAYGSPPSLAVAGAGGGGGGGGGGGAHRTPSPAGPGYARHEIEGIGGVVKTKLVRMVRVGACVPEWEDEKARGEVLGREVQGRVRSWCGWCWRVVPGKADYDAARRLREREAGLDGDGRMRPS